MPVTMLLVEGALDAELLERILTGAPPVKPAKASKNALAPMARHERGEGNDGVHYLRDRDFDFEPPVDSNSPTVDREHAGAVLGWRWARHEIENYMLEPAVVRQACGANEPEYVGALVAAACSMAAYQAARWVIGTARRALPPFYDLKTRPDENEGGELALPADLSEGAVVGWMTQAVQCFHARVASALDERAVRNTFKEKAHAFSAAFVQDTRNVLVWFSGKDLMAGLREWASTAGYASPGQFRAVIRDWMRANPERVLDCLPEWRNLRDMLQQS